MRVVRHESELGRWELVRALPDPRLRHWVSEYVGWWEHMTAPVCRREMPSETVPLIINFGSPVRIFDAAAPDDLGRSADFGSFTTGVYDTFVLVGTSGASGGLQVNFTFPGARLFLNRPLADLANRVVAMDDVMGASVSSLADRLLEIPTWPGRFDLIEQLIVGRCGAAAEPPARIMRASQRLIDSRGRLAIASLADEAGCTPKHLAAQFRDQFGITPKSLARVLRFGGAIERIKHREGAATPRLADLALECGYYDQAHFARDFRAFAGVSPTELLRSIMPDGGGFTATR